MKAIIEDTRCMDALDDLLCSIQKISQPELQFNKPNHPTHREKDEEKYSAYLHFLSHMSIPKKMLIDALTFGWFSDYIYR